MDAALGYEKNQKGHTDTTNKRNGYSPEKLKSQYGELQINVLRDRNGEFEPKIVPKYKEMSPESKKRSSRSMPGG